MILNPRPAIEVKKEGMSQPCQTMPSFRETASPIYRQMQESSPQTLDSSSFCPHKCIMCRVASPSKGLGRSKQGAQNQVACLHEILFSREIISSSPTTPFQALGCDVQENDNGPSLAWPLIFFTFENIPTNTKEVFCQEHPLAQSTW